MVDKEGCGNVEFDSSIARLAIASVTAERTDRHRQVAKAAFVYAMYSSLYL